MHIVQLSLVTGGRLDAQDFSLSKGVYQWHNMLNLDWCHYYKKIIKKVFILLLLQTFVLFWPNMSPAAAQGWDRLRSKMIYSQMIVTTKRHTLERFENSEIFFWKSNNLIFRFGPNSESFLFFSPFLGADLEKDLVASESQTRVFLATSNAQTIWLKQRNTAITLSPKVN